MGSAPLQLGFQGPAAAVAEIAALDTLDQCWPDTARWMPHMPQYYCQTCTRTVS